MKLQDYIVTIKIKPNVSVREEKMQNQKPYLTLLECEG